MDEKAKVNVRGSMASLAAGETLELERAMYTQRSVRNTATDLAAVSGKRYTVRVSGDRITITRIQ